jgi:hypothetical protein
MNNPFENKAIKFETEQELNHLAELAKSYGLNVYSLSEIIDSKRYFRNVSTCAYYSDFNNSNDLPEITYSDFIASLQPIEPQPDMVNHPKHYNVDGYEVIDIIDAFKLNFNMGNALKYLLRADRKGNKLQDLKKALWYLQREIEQSEKQN